MWRSENPPVTARAAEDDPRRAMVETSGRERSRSGGLRGGHRGGEELTGHAADRVRKVVSRVRELAEIDTRVRLESENSFPSNVGLGSSSSGFAAAAMAATEAAGLDLSRPDVSTIARLGSSSAARAVTGGFSDLHMGLNDHDCRSERLESPLEDDVRIVAGLVPAYKETEEAHREAADSHMFEARLAHIHDQLVEMRDALRVGDFDRVFETAEHDSLSLAATTMTGPAGWVYWKPETLEIFDTVRELRDEEGIPAYYSTDTGASVYVNTTRRVRRRSRGRHRRLRCRDHELEGRRPRPNPPRGRRAVLRRCPTSRHSSCGEYAFSLAARCTSPCKSQFSARATPVCPSLGNSKRSSRRRDLVVVEETGPPPRPTRTPPRHPAAVARRPDLDSAFGGSRLRGSGNARGMGGGSRNERKPSPSGPREGRRRH